MKQHLGMSVSPWICAARLCRNERAMGLNAASATELGHRNKGARKTRAANLAGRSLGHLSPLEV